MRKAFFPFIAEYSAKTATTDLSHSLEMVPGVSDMALTKGCRHLAIVCRNYRCYECVPVLVFDDSR